MATKMNDAELCNVVSGVCFRFYKFGTHKLLPILNLKLDESYVELGGAFDSVDHLDRKPINENQEMVRIIGKFNKIFMRV